MKKFKSYSQKTSILDLPTPILTDILSSLPTKSILPCKIVNKLWCSIIKDPKFRKPSKYITMIVHCTDDNKANKNLRLVEPQVNYTVSKGNGNLCLLVGKEAVIKLSNDDGFDGIPVKSLEIVNSCKGLVCFSSDYWDCVHFVVCNPVMSDYVVVQHLMSAEMPSPFSHKHTGFGCSSKTDEYKVLRLFDNLEKKDVDGFCCLEAYVCTLGGDDEWRLLENRPPQGDWYGMATFFEGAIHWIIVHKKTLVRGIVAFDCQDETFIAMDFPSVYYIHDGLWKAEELAVLRSQLCVCILTFNVYKYQNNIWVMNEYGVKESWRKLFVVSFDTIDRLMPVKPLVYWNNGEIVMLSGNRKLVSYDATSNTWRAIKIPGVLANVEAMLLDPIFIPTKTLLMQGNNQRQK